ncbi:DUF1287 domain-containing protein [Motilimonas pumila]|uniref:DUF1287 domain-containing protein n=1 Tax=Motilimonas pumila TaxID=2303987 RepID=A0A418YBY9_9GAMM|nr:DUF1287 domain-containing protein [Motilimonas pumila]RJG42024.1 DUF1287 domain-containing protein [Motilimonas pumila]
MFARYLYQAVLVFAFTVPSYSSPAFADSQQQLVDAAMNRTTQKVTYDGSYHAMSYPGGDVPSHIGVCTDVIIRSYRQLGIDLQQRVHEDMQQHFEQYPSQRIWGLSKTDANIDHRRVPNLQAYFGRHGQTLAITDDGKDYQPGDIVTWMLPGNLPHIGIIVDERSADNSRHKVVHNIGSGPILEDMLFSFKITGHYRYLPR